jgi:hypothetical protein
MEETMVAWELAVVSCEHTIEEVRMMLSIGYRAGGLSRDELQKVKEEVKVWEESFPAILTAWQALQAKRISTRPPKYGY